VGGEVGAYEGGIDTVEGGVEAVRGAVLGKVRGFGRGGTAHDGEVDAEVRVPVGAAAPFTRARGEEEAQPFEGAADKVVHVDAPYKRWPCPGRSLTPRRGLSISKLHQDAALCIQVQRDPHDRAGHCRSTLDV
jgi:hypothetical protein